MTENRRAPRVHKLCTICAPIVCLALAGPAQADAAWQMFLARCLDAYAHQAPAAVGELPLQSKAEGQSVYGPTAQGYTLVLNGALERGDRSCAVAAPGGAAKAAKTWSFDQLGMGRFVGAGDGWLASNEWIEPQIMVKVEVSADSVQYVVVETDLES